MMGSYKMGYFEMMIISITNMFIFNNNTDYTIVPNHEGYYDYYYEDLFYGLDV